MFRGGYSFRRFISVFMRSMVALNPVQRGSGRGAELAFAPANLSK
jgi:hypothetical protein